MPGWNVAKSLRQAGALMFAMAKSSDALARFEETPRRHREPAPFRPGFQRSSRIAQLGVQ